MGMNIRFSTFSFVTLVLTLPVLAFGQVNPRHVESDPRFDRVETLEQQWTDKDSNWFYNVPQGSRLGPYNWFINLEQADNQDKFASPKNIQKLG